MLQGLGAHGAASLGPFSLAATSIVGVCNEEALWSLCTTVLNGRSFASAANVELSAAPGPNVLASVPKQSSRAFHKQPPLIFSLRPSILSPLYSTWDRTRKLAQRREQLTALLKSRVLLSSSFQAKNDKDLVRQVRQRIRDIHQTSVTLAQVLDDPGRTASVARCPSPAHAAAYCAALEELTLTQDAAAHEFGYVQRGEVSPWSHYVQHFLQPYQNAPRLEPLEVIFSKPDPVDVVRQLHSSPVEAAQSEVCGKGAGIAGKRGPVLSKPRVGPHIDVEGVTHTAGKRKTSSATLDLVLGSGEMIINGLPIASYFRDPGCRQHALQPLLLTGSEHKYDICVHVRGGGLSGQAQAIRTAVARALCVQQPSLATELEELTRWDGRVVERKKFGRAKARAGFTWVKR